MPKPPAKPASKSGAPSAPGQAAAAPAPAVTARPRRVIWVNVLTVVSAAILIGVEVFGAAFAAGWAFAMLFNLGEYGVPVLQTIFFLIGLAVMAKFLMNARKIEPFFSRG